MIDAALIEVRSPPARTEQNRVAPVGSGWFWLVRSERRFKKKHELWRKYPCFQILLYGKSDSKDKLLKEFYMYLLKLTFIIRTFYSMIDESASLLSLLDPNKNINLLH